VVPSRVHSPPFWQARVQGGGAECRNSSSKPNSLIVRRLWLSKRRCKNVTQTVSHGGLSEGL
jgi:hypothetical protein